MTCRSQSGPANQNVRPPQRAQGVKDSRSSYGIAGEDSSIVAPTKEAAQRAPGGRSGWIGRRILFRRTLFHLGPYTFKQTAPKYALGYIIVSGQNRETETLAELRLFLMRNILVLLCFAFTTSAASISVGPIYMSGSGSFEWDYNGDVDAGWQEMFSASGSSGSDYVSLFVLGGYDEARSVFGDLPTSFPQAWSNCGGCWGGDVMIDGIFGEIPPVLGPIWPADINTTNAEIGNGGGSISIYDSGGNLLAAASLIGYVQYTNVTERFNGDTLVGVNADFIIVPTPEPATWGVCLVGLAIVAFRVRKNLR
jgi:hypothetical protein